MRSLESLKLIDWKKSAIMANPKVTEFYESLNKEQKAVLMKMSTSSIKGEGREKEKEKPTKKVVLKSDSQVSGFEKLLGK